MISTGACSPWFSNFITSLSSILNLCTPSYCYSLFFFFFNDTPTTEIYTLSLHDALPISNPPSAVVTAALMVRRPPGQAAVVSRSEEHTSELQSRFDLVCRLLLEKKKKNSFVFLTKTERKIKQPV